MLSESQKRKGTISVLEKLRAQGAPTSTGEADNMDNMFAKVDEEGKIVSGEEPLTEEEKKKKKKKAYERGDGETRMPAPNQESAKKIVDFFKR
jgi:hypothetical protein